jgi:cytochrome P450
MLIQSRWPPAAGLLSKVAPPEGDTFNGVFIPGGTEIGQCAWSIQRSKKVFGDDSAIFRPERWLEAKGEKLEAMEKTLGLLWGFGKYSCLGKNIAMMELNKVFFMVSDSVSVEDSGKDQIFQATTASTPRKSNFGLHNGIPSTNLVVVARNNRNLFWLLYSGGQFSTASSGSSSSYHSS